ncbi:quinone oxidoreductase-like protein 2 homolog [Clavelina lepadiformis]|uniref:quinone oxidoreductase-like protein 2 homolog n=1 Tax=Clavelina lepadiformis TaxID=159417 RepID=UPI0040435B26
MHKIERPIIFSSSSSQVSNRFLGLVSQSCAIAYNMKRSVLKCPPELLLRQVSTKHCGQQRLGNELYLRSPPSTSILAGQMCSSSAFQRRHFKAAFCTELGKPLSLGLKESSELCSGEVRIQVAAVGINFSDLLMVKGEYQVKLSPPFTPGGEMSGTILEVADDVHHFKPGMKVLGLCSAYGAFAEEVVTTCNAIWEMPSSMSFKEAAGFVCSYGTAMMGLSRRANLQHKENVLVTAAAGAAGLAAVDIASNVFGCNVFGAAGSDEKCSLVKSYGAKETINYRNESLRDKMKKICPQGANVIFDAVGGSAFKDSLRSIAWEGRLIVVGFASGEIPQIPANHLLVKNVSAVGLFWGAYSMANLDVFRWSVDECLKHYIKGQLKPHVCATYDFSMINQAFQFIQSRKSTGKVVVEIRD